MSTTMSAVCGSYSAIDADYAAPIGRAPWAATKRAPAAPRPLVYWSPSRALEVEARAELPEPLRALQRVAGEGVRLAEAVEDGGVLLVEDVEHLGDELDTVAAAEDEVLREADVELLEGGAALAVDV